MRRSGANEDDDEKEAEERAERRQRGEKVRAVLEMLMPICLLPANVSVRRKAGKRKDTAAAGRTSAALALQQFCRDRRVRCAELCFAACLPFERLASVTVRETSFARERNVPPPSPALFSCPSGPLQTAGQHGSDCSPQRALSQQRLPTCVADRQVGYIRQPALGWPLVLSAYSACTLHYSTYIQYSATQSAITHAATTSV